MLANKKNSWETTYKLIRTKNAEAFEAIDAAIKLEESEKPNEAISKYKEGIRLIDEALSVQVQCPDDPDETWEKARSMIQKIKKTRGEVMTRLNCIQGEAPEDPPSYDQAMSSSEDEEPRTYKDLATALQELSVDPNQTLHEETVYSHDNVRVYFISPNGEVLSTQQPETLKISLVEGSGPNSPKAILQVGSWIYPLVPGVSPCYRTNYGAFILPDLNATTPGSSVGIILPSDAHEEVFDLLENILCGIVGATSKEEIKRWIEQRDTEAPEEDISTRISNKIIDGAFCLSRGLVRGAEKAGEYMNNKTPALISKMQPAGETSNVPEPLAKSMQVAENATSKAAKVTGYLAEKVGVATVRLGRFLAPHIQRGGTKLLVKGFNMSEDRASDRVKGALTVAAGAVEGFSAIYRGLETSAAVLGSSLKENTVKIVEHKYGYPASTLTGDTLSTVGNVYNIAQSARIITPRGLVKRTGVGLVHGYASSSRAGDFGNDEDDAGCSKSESTEIKDDNKKEDLQKK